MGTWANMDPKTCFLKLWIQCIHLEIKKTHIRTHIWGFSWEIGASGKARPIFPQSTDLLAQTCWHRPERHPSSLLRATLTTCLACTCSWAGDPAFTSCLLHRVTFLGNSHVHSIAFICNSHSSLNSCRLGNSQPRIRNWSNCQSLAFFDQWHIKYGSHPSLFCETQWALYVISGKNHGHAQRLMVWAKKHFKPYYP